MGGRTAIGIHDDLAAGEAAIALRAADHKTTGRIHEEVDVALEELLWDDRFDDVLNHRLAEGRFADIGRMLGRHHHGMDGVRTPVDVANGDLTLGVGAQPSQLAVVTKTRLTFYETMGEINRHRHQGRRFIAGITEHQALITSSLAKIIVKGLVDALGNIRRLLVVGHQNGAALVVDAVFGVGIADLLQYISRHLDVINACVGGDLPSQHDETGITEGLSRDSGVLILSEEGIQNGIGDLIGNLIGMAF